MRKTTMTLALSLIPAALVAQQSGAGATTATQATARAGASVHATKPTLPARVSAQGRARIEAVFARAQERRVPTAPIERRIQEGEAKGASEAALVVAAQRTEARLEASQRAFVQAGRQPSDVETEAGADAMAHGVTSAQLQALATSAPGDRSLVVALETLTELRARGVASAQAVAQLQANLAARASDAAISALVSTGSAVGSALGATNAAVDLGASAGTQGRASAGGAAGGANAGGSVAGGASVSGAAAGGMVNGATGAAGSLGATAGSATGSLTGSVTGGVTGGIKRP